MSADLRQAVRRLRWFVAPAVLLATPLLALHSPQDVQIPPLKERAKPAPAVFSHWEHSTQYQCFNCHPGTFPQAREGFTHQDMKAGRYCGSCHDGEAAAEIKSMRCEVCHAAR